MDDEILVVLACPFDYESRANAEALALSLLQEAKRMGGAGWAGWVDRRLNVRIQNANLQTVQPIVHAWVHAAERDSKSLSIIQQTRAREPLPGPRDQIPWGTVVHTRLTRTLLVRLPEGAWVISNCYAGSGEPIFEQRLGPAHTRQAAWRLAIEAGANNRICRVAWTDVELNGPTIPPWLGGPIKQR